MSVPCLIRGDTCARVRAKDRERGGEDVFVSRARARDIVHHFDKRNVCVSRKRDNRAILHTQKRINLCDSILDFSFLIIGRYQSINIEHGPFICKSVKVIDMREMGREDS